MDAEGLGRKLLLTPSDGPRRAPEKQTVGTVTASHKMLTLQALSSSLNAGTAKRGRLGQGEPFGCPPAICAPKRPHPFARYREKVPQRNCVTKILRNVRVNFLVRSALVLLDNDPAIPSNCSENSLVLSVRFFGFVGPFWLLIYLNTVDTDF